MLQTVSRAVQCLLALAEQPVGLTLTELTKTVGSNKATVHRIVATLKRFDLVAATDPSGRLRLGAPLRRRRAQRRARTITRRADGQAPLAAGMVLDQRRHQRELVGQLDQHGLEVALQRAGLAAARAGVGLLRIAPDRELRRDRLLQGLAMREVELPARAGADEVRLVELETFGQRRHLDQARDEIGLGGREASPSRGRSPCPAC